MSCTLANYWGQRSFLQPKTGAEWWELSETDIILKREPKENESILTPIPIRRRRLFEVEIPSAITHIVEAIDKSEYILDLPDNWDDEGSPKYERETWERAAKFVLQNSLELWRKENFSTKAPVIHNGPNASIDIHWKTSKSELLINVPSDRKMPATYYGFNRATGAETKGNLDTSAPNEWLLMWITTNWDRVGT